MKLFYDRPFRQVKGRGSIERKTSRIFRSLSFWYPFPSLKGKKITLQSLSYSFYDRDSRLGREGLVGRVRWKRRSVETETEEEVDPGSNI